MFRCLTMSLYAWWFISSSAVAQVLPLQGSEVYRRLGNDIYLASVYSGQPDSRYWQQPETVLKLEMDIIADHLSPRRFYRLWSEGLAINLSDAGLKQWAEEIPRFTNLLKDDLLTGDKVVISNETGACRVSINQVEVLLIEDGDFVHHLVTAWIGKFPQSAQLREGLINLSDEEKTRHAQLLAKRRFAQGRDEVIRRWLLVSSGNDYANDTVPVAALNKAGLPESQTVSAAHAALELPSAVIPVASAPSSADIRRDVAAGAVPVITDIASRSTVARDVVVKDVAEKGTAIDQVLAPEPDLQAHRQAHYLDEVRYLKTLLQHANAKAAYPAKALRRRIQGMVIVALQLDAQGQVVSADMVESSGFPLLDHAALRAARLASPYPEPPAGLNGEFLEFDIPFRFALAQ